MLVVNSTDPLLGADSDPRKDPTKLPPIGTQEAYAQRTGLNRNVTRWLLELRQVSRDADHMVASLLFISVTSTEE